MPNGIPTRSGMRTSARVRPARPTLGLQASYNLLADALDDDHVDQVDELARLEPHDSTATRRSSS